MLEELSVASPGRFSMMTSSSSESGSRGFRTSSKQTYMLPQMQPQSQASVSGLPALHVFPISKRGDVAVVKGKEESKSLEGQDEVSSVLN
ncbi:unnamed protein product [Linum trigynum]|uniref:Uncharacterized protein n=1 Tax=Linum trigynum TaxID=586398 RepID=A0AAV2E7R8_9ROSI